MKKHQLKLIGKMIAVMLVIALSFSLAACGSSAPSADGGSSSGSSESGSGSTDRETDIETDGDTDIETEAETEAQSEEESEKPETEGAETTDDQAAGGSVPAEAVGHYSFSSGAGGWSTELELAEDGSFSGEFHDSDMGDTGEGYPMGTVYICGFSGTFSNFEEIGDGLYSMELTSLTQEEVEDEETIEDDVRFVGAYPYGICSYEDRDVVGNTYYLYMPGYPTDGLSDDFLMWAGSPYWPEGTEGLPFWCLSTGELSSGGEYVFTSPRA